MRLTIERMRTLVVAAGILLLAALAVFLVLGKWKSPFNRRDIPQHLGIEIQQEANGVTYTQAHGGHTLFKIHASKVVQLRNNTATLHDVQIDLYGADGSRVDRIQGNEFEYDQKAGKAFAAGPVEITLMRPGVTPAIAAKPAPPPHGGAARGGVLATTAQAAGVIEVMTSGLTFDQQSGVVTTAQRVDFSMAQGSGSAMGAMYDSEQGYLVLDHAVQLTTRSGSDTVRVFAQHAEFDRDAHLCLLRQATAQSRGDQAEAAQAKILFRDDGSAVRLDANGGFTLTTATGGRISAPAGSMDFDAHNQPRYAHLQGGVQMDSVSGQRTVHGSAPTAILDFGAQGRLRHAHLERGVELHSRELSQLLLHGQSVPVQVNRTWRSPVADVDFREAGNGQVEPAALRGTGGVLVTSEARRGSALPLPSQLSADTLTGAFGPGAVLTSMTGTGHASLQESTASGARQTATGDRIEARFAPAIGAKNGPQGDQVQSALLEGNVVLVQQPSPHPGAQPQLPLHATAGRALFEGAGQWLHLTLSPRVWEGGIELTANKLDVSQESGDALAHGDVKATWLSGGAPGTANAPALGGQGPAHVIAAEAQLHQASDEATFSGHARLWQQANSVAAPLIVLNRQKQTLTAHSGDTAEPVRVVLLNSGARAQLDASRPAVARPQPASPSVIRVRGGDLWYSDASHTAILRGGALGAVIAQTGDATSRSAQVELQLAAPAHHGSDSAAQVERMTATGNVVLTMQGRRGVGEQLVYTGVTGDYVLTGTAAAPPRISDPEQGSVTGMALIFHSRDDSVSIEGGGRTTTTETTAPQPRRKKAGD